PNLASATACAAATHCIGESGRLIEYGDADVMICGGAESTLSPLGVAGLCALRSEEHTSELQSLAYLVCRLLLEKKKKKVYSLYIKKANYSNVYKKKFMIKEYNNAITKQYFHYYNVKINSCLHYNVVFLNLF